MPCAESRLIEKPQVKNEPASCQNASVCSASLAVTRSTGAATVPGLAVPPSGNSPTDSGESRSTQRQSGSSTTSIAPAITTYVKRHPRDRHEHAVEEQAQRDHGGEARAVEAEIGHDRLEERPDGVAHSRRHECRDGEGRDDPPPVEDRSIGHVVSTISGATYARFRSLAQANGVAAFARRRRSRRRSPSGT